MTQPALSRLEAGGVIPSGPLLDRISAVLDADLIVKIAPHAAQHSSQLPMSGASPSSQLQHAAPRRPAGISAADTQSSAIGRPTTRA
jgi:hypothetical protein